MCLNVTQEPAFFICVHAFQTEGGAVVLFCLNVVFIVTADWTVEWFSA